MVTIIRTTGIYSCSVIQHCDKMIMGEYTGMNEGYTQIIADIVSDRVILHSTDESITFDKNPAQVRHADPH